MIRLQKVLAQAGVGSRRTCEQLIAEGRVEVDGAVVEQMGVRVDPATRRDPRGRAADRRRPPTSSYLALNKPRGVISSMGDPQGRPSLADYVATDERLFHVGRLDADTEGLILLTNDGPLAHRLTHPSFEVPKTYLAEVPGPIGRGLGKQLREGVDLDDGLARVDSFRVVSSSASRVMVEVVLHEGRKHIVRRMLAEVGHPVSRLVRTKIGPVSLGGPAGGPHPVLNRQELGELYQLVGL